jgi:hypothetical protein
MNLHKIACHVLLVLAASTAMLAQAPMVEEQAPMLEETDAAELIGGTVQSAEGLEVGQVCSVALKPDGEVTEIRMTTEQALGMGSGPSSFLSAAILSCGGPSSFGCRSGRFADSQASTRTRASRS